MVAYQGSSLLEDYTLNGAGFYAVFVALVPTNLDETLGALRGNSNPDGLSPTDYVASLRTALTTVLVLCAVLAWKELTRSGRITELWQSHSRSKVFIAGTSAILGLFLLLAMAQLWLPDPNDVTMDGISLGPVHLRIHDLAAILLIAALAVAVGSHAFPEALALVQGSEVGYVTDLGLRRAYRAILVLMVPVAFVVAALAWALARDHVVIVLEWWEIALFSLFWVLETRRIGSAAPGSPVQEAAAAG